MIAELTAAVTCMNAITSLAKSLANGPADVEWKTHVAALVDNILDLQSKLLSIQSQYQEIFEQNQKLKKQLDFVEAWQITTDRYLLSEIEVGMFVYVLRSECRGEEPLHWLCPNCFQKQQKSLMIRPNVSSSLWNCQNCSFKLVPTTPY